MHVQDEQIREVDDIFISVKYLKIGIFPKTDGKSKIKSNKKEITFK